MAAADNDVLGGDPVYSRLNIPTVDRLEAVLSAVVGAPCVSYCSGLSAAHALLQHLAPRNIFIQQAEKGGYHGTLGVISLFEKISGMKRHTLEADETILQKGDVVCMRIFSCLATYL